jgi:FkbM family methyltransferase
MVTRLARQGIVAGSVIDIGANKGQFTIAARNILRPAVVHSFEPLPDVVHALERNCARYPEVNVHPFAVGAEDGTATLHVNAHSQSSSLLPIGERHLQAFPQAREIRELSVEVRRLDSILDRSELAGPVLMKIDSQGFEVPVLKGARGVLDCIDLIVAETSFAPMYEGEVPFVGLLEHLHELKFELVRPVDLLADDATGELLQMDVLFRREGSGCGSR